jgi:Flp pilus assembly pilin Flp
MNMKKIVDATGMFWRREEGAWLIEYALLVGLIAIACLSIISLFGTSLRDYILNIASVLGGV